MIQTTPDPKEHEASTTLRSLLIRSIRDRCGGDAIPGVLLSGGLASSIVAAVMVREFGRIRTFAAGMPGSADLEAARVVALALGTVHHETVFDESQAVAALPQVIDCVEAYSGTVVRNAVPIWFALRSASAQARTVLTGSAAHDVFAECSRADLMRPPEDLLRERASCLASLDQNELQSVDRMSAAFGLTVRMPFLDHAFVEYVLSLPPRMFLGNGLPGDRRLLVSAFGPMLPERTVRRRHETPCVGAGSSALFAHRAASISDGAFLKESSRARSRVRTREELLYYREFTHRFHRDGAENNGTH